MPIISTPKTIAINTSSNTNASGILPLPDPLVFARKTGITSGKSRFITDLLHRFFIYYNKTFISSQEQMLIKNMTFFVYTDFEKSHTYDRNNYITASKRRISGKDYEIILFLSERNILKLYMSNLHQN